MDKRDAHWIKARQMTLILYCAMGVFAFTSCIMSTKIDDFWSLAIVLFWIVSFIFLLLAKKKELYGLSMLLFAAVLGCCIKITTGSMYGMMSVFIIQWIGGIFFMWEETVPLTVIIQEVSLIFMLFFPFKEKPLTSDIFECILSTVLVAVSAFSCKGLVSMLNTEVELNKRNADERSKLLVEIQKQYAEVQNALNAKSEFLASMSHEIRTPINTIIGMNEVALRECKQDNILEPMRNISLASDNLLSIINDVLDFSKVESGNMEIVSKPYNLREIINNIVRMHSLRAQNKGLQFTVSVSPDTPAELEGDEVRVFQVLSNLISNAIKYTDKGIIEIFVGPEMKSNGHVVLYFSVKDSGIGIRDEDRDKLFQAFQRLDMNRNCTVEGTGLGLALVDKVVKAMHGEIYVDSTFGKGSTFTVCFPQKVLSDEMIGAYLKEDFKSTIKKATYKNSFTAPDARILFVDDNQMNLAVATSLLKYTKVQVTTCMSGKECLKLTSDEHFDIIFLDHMMPEMDGIETLKRLKMMVDNPCQDTPVIALTANAIAGSREKYLEAGFDNYLSKPIMYKDFEEMILQYLPEELVITAEPEAEDIEKSASVEETAAETVEESDNTVLIDEQIGLEYSGNDEAFYHQLLEMFAGEAKRISESLDSSFGSSDWKTYQREAHTLKGNSKGVGAEALSEAARELEQLAKDGNAEAIASKHPNLLALNRRVIDEISVILSK